MEPFVRKGFCGWPRGTQENLNVARSYDALKHFEGTINQVERRKPARLLIVEASKPDNVNQLAGYLGVIALLIALG